MTSEERQAGDDLVLRLAALAYFARFSVVSRIHTKSDLRWMQEVRRFKPATVARRLAVLAGFYCTCVIGGVLDRSPADYVRRPRVSNESPTLGLSHLQFEALLCAARDSDNPPDFALVAMLGLLGLRISEACRCDIDDLGEEHGHRVLRTVGKGTKSGRRSARCPDRRAPRRSTHHHALRPRPHQPRPAPELHTRGLHSLCHMTSQPSAHAECRVSSGPFRNLAAR
ncbi:hypothetical protein [Nocardia sp. NPDC005825]|uniref:hypothetical protein n=1 Tax=unclassified Nocardia TaxID=2637762 RepID=UPI00340AAA1F